MKSGSKNSQDEESGIYEFGPYSLDARERILLLDGQAVALTPKALDTLIVLVRNQSKVVSKEELLASVWPGTFVEEGILAQNIMTLRKALRNPEWIETVPKRGYRFSHKVSSLAPEMRVAAPVRWRFPWWWPTTAAVLLMGAVAVVLAMRWERPKPRIRSLAVLPLRAIDEGPPHLGLGLADVLINRLGMLSQLAVRPTSAVRKFTDGAAPNPLAAGRELGVDAVLEGNIQRDGERVRVTVQLWRVSDGASLWSGKFDQPYRDLFTLEDAIGEQIAQGLVLDLTAPERERLRRRYTENAEAWQAYLRGRYLWSRRTPEAYRKAIAEFEEAARIDPNYALAYAGLADAYALLGSNPNQDVPRAEAMEKARAAALKSIALDADLAEAHTALAFILMHYDWKCADAEKEFQRALSLNPSYATAHQWRAINLLVTGHPDEGLQELKSAQALDPASLIIMADRVEMDVYTGRLLDAIDQGKRALDIDPSFTLVQDYLSWAFTGQRRFAEAVAVLGPDAQTPDAFRLDALEYAYAAEGRQDEARLMLRKLVERARQEHGLEFMVASSYAVLGDADGMVPWIEKAFSERSGALLLLHLHPAFAPVREDSRFKAFVSRVGL
ncbi:MAG TPA: winged helix-turn-helix domain-containing protein [Bryobacteraceae bacterium]|jgi:DNA-binding winged helix-turn-helix (wHTH) protein/TolB-like protein/Tfp pilus assembly protein PilF|nr:winged helix-turn-helix domain-containing protein [Bryobacteraceae bacterium]